MALGTGLLFLSMILKAINFSSVPLANELFGLIVKVFIFLLN
ncbi:hypothetical protein PROPEN_03091 [Proteus penneri ATCC 35198]|nr:hypothetical protein PROPEN_03091 [Proteus penneri ATCC 35198]